MFFVQNAGAPAAGTGLEKSNIIQKISLAEAEEVVAGGNASATVDVVTVDASPAVINSNGSCPRQYCSETFSLTSAAGATNYRGQIVFTGEGQGNETAPALYLMNPREPYNTTGKLTTSSYLRCVLTMSTVLVNNFAGRQFNSLNDVAVNPRNGELYFTDSLYGYLQDFRPPPGLPTQVYRLNTDTGVLSAVADGFDKPNGMSPAVALFPL